MSTRILPLLALLFPLVLAGCLEIRTSGSDDDDTSGGDDDDTSGDDDDSSGGDDDTSGDDDDDTSGDDDDTSGGDDDDTTPVSEACAEAISRLTNIGCEFWAVDLDNAENFADDAAGGQFAVAVANTHDSLTATVQVHINEADPGQALVETLVSEQALLAGSLYIFELPRRDADGDNITTHTDDGPQTWHSSRAFRISSDVPIVAYQFNTLDQQYSNDASLLLPTHSLGTQHYVLSYPSSGPFEEILSQPGPKTRCYVTVVGVSSATEVTVTPSADIVDGVGVSAVSTGVGIAQGTPRTFTLGPYDVLNLETTLIELSFSMESPDLTGTVVVSDSPVAVFTGTDLSVVSSGVQESPCCAEHLEEQVLPTRAMRNNFVVSRSAQRSTGDPEYDVYRIMAGASSANVTTSLAGNDASFSLASGEYYELMSTAGFVVEATAPVQIAQYLVAGEDLPSGTLGDSSMIVIPPVEQRQDEYVFTTGEGFSSNWVVLSALDGTEITLDGQSLATSGCTGPVTDGVLGSDTYVAWTCPIDDGVHTAEAAEDFALVVYGYYSAGSYAYPGGSGVE